MSTTSTRRVDIRQNTLQKRRAARLVGALKEVPRGPPNSQSLTGGRVPSLNPTGESESPYPMEPLIAFSRSVCFAIASYMASSTSRTRSLALLNMSLTSVFFSFILPTKYFCSWVVRFAKVSIFSASLSEDWYFSTSVMTSSSLLN